jgi:tetratricopeptide (TPR) repeat protein
MVAISLRAMPALEPPDSHHLSAAIGWLELGNPGEAEFELNRIAAARQEHPDVLEARWQTAAARQDWAAALRAAQRLMQAAPGRSSAWLHHAYALRRAPGGGLEQAWAALLPARAKFPKVALIPYNLACYAAQLGRLDQAWDLLHEAMERAGDLKPVKAMALADPDLAPLWERIREL